MGGGEERGYRGRERKGIGWEGGGKREEKRDYVWGREGDEEW